MKNRIRYTILVLLISQYVIAQSPNEKLNQLVGNWIVTESSFADPSKSTVVVTPVANGHAIYSTLKQGSGENYYEANALWGYSERTKQVRVFEVNTNGVAETHIGNFNESGNLTLELSNPETMKLLEKRTMHWTPDIWKMTALFIINGEEAEHHITFVRQKGNKVDLAKEEEQIREVWDKISLYGMKGDWADYSKYFNQTRKLQMIHPGMKEWLNGWSEFSEKYEDMMEKGMKYSIIKNHISVNVSNSGDMAWGLVDFIFSFDSDPNNKVHMWESVVFEKTNGEWNIVMGMASNVPDNE